VDPVGLQGIGKGFIAGIGQEIWKTSCITCIHECQNALVTRKVWTSDSTISDVVCLEFMRGRVAFPSRSVAERRHVRALNFGIVPRLV
jgi:hypothetical protein